jgi:hypothetical protein
VGIATEIQVRYSITGMQNNKHVVKIGLLRSGGYYDIDFKEASNPDRPIEYHEDIQRSVDVKLTYKDLLGGRHKNKFKLRINDFFKSRRNIN